MAELTPLVQGARVVEVRGFPPRDLELVLELGSEASGGGPPARPRRLCLSADPDLPRVYLARERRARHEGPTGPFFRRLAAELEGALLARLEQVALDRIVRLEFHGAQDGERRLLFAELVGRHANLLLAGPGERLRDWLIPPPDGAAKVARLVLGEPWAAPPGRPGKAALDTPLSLLLPAPAEPEPEFESAGPSAAHGPRTLPQAPLSWRVERVLGDRLRELRHSRAARDLRERLERRAQRTNALVKGLEQRLLSTRAAERVLQDGELLKANLGRVPRGAKSIEVDDWFDPEGAKRSIAVDPRRSPQDNVELIFERYHKLLRGAQSVEQELALARSKASALAELLRLLEGPSSDPAALEARALAQGLLEPPQEADPRKREAPAPRKCYREYTGLKGSSILVGRNAADNDELTLRVARGNDLWLHTRDAPGSHVVLRLERGAEPDSEEVLDAATLAVHFSPLAEAHKAAVHVARRKQVHKPRGAKPGLVALSGGKSLEVRMQPDRLRRLLSTARGPLPPVSGTLGTPEAP
ncbi:MAG: DUF814 domain-containing protein [Planctomycetes bacterium]|nr:DUF814 domain-containing protein [Planctomycetota bacterium]